MKQAILPLLSAALLFAACKETAPPIDFGPKASDTTFTTAIETPQQRVVVIEEFTGVKCSNCPAGHVIIKGLEAANAGRIASIGLQIFGFAQCNPVTVNDNPAGPTRHDNRTQAGTDIANDVYGSISSMPVAGIDRVEQSGSMLLDRGTWTGIVNNRLAIPPAANITIYPSYNTATRQVAIKVHVAYTSSVAKAQKLTVALVESNITDAQEGDASVSTPFNPNYVHQHVLRDVLTAPSGAPFLSDKAIKSPGQVYERTFVYNVNADWNPDNCEIVAFVSNNEGNDKEVVQGAITHLK